MSRHGYSDDCDYNDGSAARWLGVIRSASRGKRGQAFFRQLLAALDAMPEKRLVKGELEENGEYCALGVLAKAKGAEVKGIDTYDHDGLGKLFDISWQLACEVMYINDEADKRTGFRIVPVETPEERWATVRAWVARRIRVTPDELLPGEQPGRLIGGGK
jgi:hypothetical protein